MQFNITKLKNYFLFQTLVVLAFLLMSSMGMAKDDPQFSEWGRSERLANPGSSLGEPFTAPIYFGAHVSFGGAFEYDLGNTGYGLEFIMRPGAAVKYLDFLYRKNIGVVLQADYLNVAQNRRILSGDFVLRKYFTDMRYPQGKVAPFIGLGVGASEITLQPPEGNGIDKYWSGVFEVGQEWNLGHKFILYSKFQYRYYNYHDVNYSNWSLAAGAGLPWPW